MNRERFLALVAEIRRHVVPPCWLRPGAAVLDSSTFPRPPRRLVVEGWRRHRGMLSGIAVRVQRTDGRRWKGPVERDLGWLDPEEPPRWTEPS